ncbi:Fic family protein [Tissierella praeacuta]|uniref:Fic family protein n=1 Tax=Tissierella praeacuta TaxID=43131 RepID=UPI003DA54F99
MFGEDRPYEEINYKAPKEYRESLWKASFGLQKIDGLKPSDYLIELSKEEINGNKTYAEIKNSLDKYYSSKESNKETEEADKVSVRIAEWLSQPRPFEKSTRRLKQIHAHLFSGIESFKYPVGKFRGVNISKEEPVLNGESVFYESWNMLDLAFQIDFEEEDKKDYSLFTEEEKAKSAMAFISNIWQIHPFREGNTRTTAVFAIEYFRSLGFEIDNTMFEKHSEYFRDALVRNNCELKYQTSYFLDCFTENLLLGGKHDLEKMDLNIESEETIKDEQNKELEDGWDLEI